MSRADRVAAGLAERELDALLVLDPANLRYLTGFGGSNGVAVVGPALRRFITDFRYVERAEGEVADFDVERGERELLATLRQGWPDGPAAARLRGRPPVRAPPRRAARGAARRVELVPAGGIVEAVRAVKEPAEVAAIRRRRRSSPTRRSAASPRTG